jgi:hypothetical protein
MMAKFNSFVLASTALALVAQIAVLTPSQAQAGPIKTGGGNGAKDPSGTVVPLDMLFAEKVERDVDIKAKFPAGYRYYQEQIAKIRAALPPLANEIEERFAQLNWSLSKLPLTGKGPSQQQNTCLNNLGTFRLQKGEKQVIIACQDNHARVKLDLGEVNSLREPRLMGVVFLHEAIVRNLIVYHSGSDYAELENELITEINPYILSNKKLEAKTLFAHALTLGFGSRDIFSPYAQFVDPKGYRLAQDIRERRIARDRLSDDFHPLLKVLVDCEPNDPRINSAEAITRFVSNASKKLAEAHDESAINSRWYISMAENVLNDSDFRFQMRHEYESEEYVEKKIGYFTADFAKTAETCRAKLNIPKPQ